MNKPEGVNESAPASGSDVLRVAATEMDLMLDTLDKHHRLAAEVRHLLHNGGAGPNISTLKRCDVMLREIAGLPVEHQNNALSGAERKP